MTTNTPTKTQINYLRDGVSPLLQRFACPEFPSARLPVDPNKGRAPRGTILGPAVRLTERVMRGMHGHYLLRTEYGPWVVFWFDGNSWDCALPDTATAQARRLVEVLKDYRRHRVDLRFAIDPIPDVAYFDAYEEVNGLYRDPDMLGIIKTMRKVRLAATKRESVQIAQSLSDDPARFVSEMSKRLPWKMTMELAYNYLKMGATQTD